MEYDPVYMSLKILSGNIVCGGGELWETIMGEFGPMLGQMLTSMSSTPSQTQITLYVPVASFNPVVNTGLGKGRGKAK